MPHEDRCVLAGLVLDGIHADTGVQIPNIVCAPWGEVTCNYLFFLVSKVQPRSRLQQMVPPGQQFTLKAAAEALITMWKLWNFDPEKRLEQAHQLLEWCVHDEQKMVDLALKRGMEEIPDQVSGAPISGSPMGKVNATQPQSMKPRALARMDTNEDYERTKQTEPWGMKVHLTEMQHKSVGLGRG